MSMGTDVGALNRALNGFTELRRFELVADKTRGGYSLSLTLGEDGHGQITLLCRDVQNLELNPEGEGFEQMLRLRVSDLRDDGLDRIRFSLEELEHETIFLHCAEMELEQVQ